MPEYTLAEKPFLEHLEDLRSCLVRALCGIAAAFAVCTSLAEPLWSWVHAPLVRLSETVGAKEIALDVGEEFTVLYLWAPLVASFFLSVPWVAYQAWRFISPGLYPRERRWGILFVLSAASLFVAGGCFGYYVVLPSSLTFLLGIGRDLQIERLVRVDSYFRSFVGILLGSAFAFELPMLVFLLTLLRVVTPAFLARHVRHAVLGIALLAAILSPSPNPVDMALISLPMLALFGVGLLASYALEAAREGRFATFSRRARSK